MITEKIDNQLMDNCIRRFKLSPTIPDDVMGEKCTTCGKPLISMRLDKSPNGGEENMSSSDMCIFRGCPSCMTVQYEKYELTRYTRDPKVSLKVFLGEIFGIK